MKRFSFSAKVWVYPGIGGWHFVNLPKNLSKQIKKVAKTYGSGFVKAKVTVGKSSWVTALFPHKESETYLISIKKQIRKKEEIFEDDKIKVSFTFDK
jgi:hypothetical protein